MATRPAMMLLAVSRWKGIEHAQIEEGEGTFVGSDKLRPEATAAIMLWDARQKKELGGLGVVGDHDHADNQSRT